MQESAIDEGMLLSIADATGGRFYRAEDAESLRQIYEEIDALEKSEFEVETFTDARELAAWAMAPALLFLLLEVLLRSTWLRTLP
jgi:Ca-activated chloride channel family protein